MQFVNTGGPGRFLLRLDDALVALCRLDLPIDTTLLAPAERGLVDSAPNDARAHELFAGRLAAKDLLAVAEPSGPARAVLHDASGRPRLDPPGELSVSIAHDGAFAAAALSPHAVGVDVCDLGRLERVALVVERRLSNGLATPFRDGSSTDEVLQCPRPVALWTAWEAAGKRSGGGVLSGPMLSEWRRASFEGVPGAVSGDVRVRWFVHDGHVISVATPLGR